MVEKYMMRHQAVLIQQYPRWLFFITISALFVFFVSNINANTNIERLDSNSGSIACKDIWQDTNFVLSEFTDWKVQASGKIVAEYLVGKEDKGSNDEVISVDFKKGRDSNKSPTILLKSNELSKYVFDDISEISIRHKSGLDGKIRVVLKDADNKAFLSRITIMTRFEDWVETRRSYSPETIVFFNKVVRSKPRPPFRISHIMFTLPLDKQTGRFSVSELAVRGNINKNRNDKSIYSTWLHKVCDEALDVPTSLSVYSKASDNPVNLGTKVDFQVVVEHKGLHDKTNASLSLKVEIEKYGTSAIQLADKIVDLSSTARSVNMIEHEFSDPGLYAMVVRLVTDGGLVIAKKSKIIAVWDPPGNNYVDNEPYFFGMMYPIDRFSKSRKQDLTLMRQAGVKIVRFPFRWSDIEIEKGKYKWNTTDRIMSDLSINGFIAQPMVFYTPDWASKGLMSMLSPKLLYLAYKRPRWIMPAELSDFSEFLTTVAKRYNKQPVAWEVWNEPTEIQHWIGGNADDYMTMLQLSAESFRLNNIDAPILSAGIGIVDAHDKTFSNKLADMDVNYGYAIHSYGGHSHAAQGVKKANGLIDKSLYQKGVWLNETGYISDPRDVTGELRRAAALVKVAVVARFHAAKNFTWFIFRNFASSTKLVTDNYAIMDSDDSVRLPLLVYAHTVHMLADTKGIKKLEMPAKSSALNAYIFENNNNKMKVVVMWLDDEYDEMSMSPPTVVGLKVEKVVTMFGNVSDPYDESTSIKVTHSPIFILYSPK